MSTYVDRSTLVRRQAAPIRAERTGHRDGEPRSRSALAAAWEELWKRSVGGSFERLPDPARHPECWFKIV
ncbi:MAG TPA: hypothetical protein VE953_25165 [Terriglobales bacterium]|nr:hypothetical protein [Terriglobales bacterium]